MGPLDKVLANAWETYLAADPKDRDWLAILDELLGDARIMATAIKKHHAQKADDRCVADDYELYAAVGLPAHDPRIGDPEAMYKNCRRFIDQRLIAGGPWKSYAELESENAQLRASLETAIKAAQSMANILSKIGETIKR